MTSVARWWARLAATVTAVSLAVFVPVAAWASTGTGELVVEAARRRSRGGFGFFGLVCCLLVVGVIVLILLLFMRRRRR
ncbi:hypothetical protein AB0J86_24425 [Micromonospora sp. NPDC049559]|uniref:hypothetical protein n=1 Tax=Micromonospora sp. NPDC049559 TaxID=3155923 RepID=UPI003416D8A9